MLRLTIQWTAVLLVLQSPCDVTPAPAHPLGTTMVLLAPTLRRHRSSPSVQVDNTVDQLSYSYGSDLDTIYFAPVDPSTLGAEHRSISGDIHDDIPADPVGPVVVEESIILDKTNNFGGFDVVHYNEAGDIFDDRAEENFHDTNDQHLDLENIQGNENLEVVSQYFNLEHTLPNQDEADINDQHQTDTNTVTNLYSEPFIDSNDIPYSNDSLSVMEEIKASMVDLDTKNEQIPHEETDLLKTVPTIQLKTDFWSQENASIDEGTSISTFASVLNDETADKKGFEGVTLEGLDDDVITEVDAEATNQEHSNASSSTTVHRLNNVNQDEFLSKSYLDQRKEKISCGSGLLRNIHNECVEPEVVRNTYWFSAPVDKPVERKGRIIAPKPKIEYNVVFVRSHDTEHAKPVVVPPPQQKTLIYVLRKTKGDSRGLLKVPTHPKLKPEVFYVNYEDENDDQVLPGGIDLRSALSKLGPHGSDSGSLFNNIGVEVNNNVDGNTDGTFINGQTQYGKYY